MIHKHMHTHMDIVYDTQTYKLTQMHILYTYEQLHL